MAGCHVAVVACRGIRAGSDRAWWWPPLVRVLNPDGSESNFFAYDPLFSGGVRAALGDINGDGIADIVLGAGPSGGPHVKVLDGATLGTLASFYAYDPSFTGGVSVASADFDGDGQPELVIAPGPGGGSHVRVLRTPDLAEIGSFDAFDPAFDGGVFIGSLPGGSGLLRFTSAPATTFAVGTAGTFTVTTEGGGGTVTLSVTGTLPGGVTFTDAGDGTAVLAGTPSAGTAGTYPLTITATRGTRTVTQVFTLTASETADQPPGFTAGSNQTVAEDSGPWSVANWATAISAGPAHEAGQAVTFIVTANTNDGVEWNGVLGIGPFGVPGMILPVDDAGTDTPDSEAHFVTVKDAGTYYVAVSAPSAGATVGTYHLSVSVLPAAPPPGTTYTSTDVPVSIPNGPATVISTLVIPDDIRIGQLKVAVDLTHNRPGQAGQ